MIASLEGHDECVELLLKRAGDVNLQDKVRTSIQQLNECNLMNAQMQSNIVNYSYLMHCTYM